MLYIKANEKSIFDSESEKKIFKRLKTFWSKYVDVFPQVPVKSVIKYEEIEKFDSDKKVVDFLLRTSFDFVVCELDTGIPLLIIEFDGLSGGFSQDGKFYMKSKPSIDKFRQLKMGTKLKLTSEFRIPMIVISYEESDVLPESGDWISVLDAIIGDAMEKRNYEKNHSRYMQMIAEAYEFGGRESAELASVEIEVINERYNPIKRKIEEITKGFPFWSEQIVFLEENEDVLKGEFKLTSGLKMINGLLYTKNLLGLELAIRKVGVFGSDSLFLFNTIGEYSLARKTERKIGTDRRVWEEVIENTKWTEIK